ncbi:MAG: histidine kinase dimerization/phosphoacceptor domain -containing protein [Flavobacteriaceae bacterium]
MYQFSKVLVLFFCLKTLSFFAQSSVEFTEAELQWIKDHQVVHFGYDPNWPPFEMYADGEYTGMVADYMAIVEQKTGIDMQPVEVESFKETLDKLKTGEVNVAPEVGKSTYRERFLSFTETYLTDPQVIVTSVNTGFVKGIKDLSYKKVSQPEGYVRIKKLKRLNPNIEIITTTDVKSALEKVSNGQAFAFVGSLSVVSYYINNLGFRNLKIASSVELGDINFRLATTKDWSVFRDICQKVFQSITDDEHRNIRNKWIAIRYDHGIDKNDVWQYILYVVLVFVAVFSLFFYWNKKLQKEIENRKEVEQKLRQTLELINEQNREKETLLKEIHHRVKNNLQMIQSLFNLQSRKVKNDYTRQVLAQGKTRIQAISLVHQLLYQSENLDKINIQDYIFTLKDTIGHIYKKETLLVDIDVNANEIYLNIDDAIAIGLILNELLVNTYKYAFVNRVKGHISIKIVKLEHIYRFEYKDDGVGVNKETLMNSNSLGMSLVTRLASQLGAQPIFKNSNGLSLTFDFKIKS